MQFWLKFPKCWSLDFAGVQMESFQFLFSGPDHSDLPVSVGLSRSRSGSAKQQKHNF